MKRNKKSSGRERRLLCAMTALFLIPLFAGCSSKEVTLPDLSSMGNATIIAREEGSGTRSEFESLVDTAQEGATEVALSTEDVMTMVADDENAIGYVAYSSLAEYDGPVKAIAVDGVEPSAESIADEDYALTRPYLIAYSGTLSDLESDFITYVRSAGQTIVAATCTPVRTAYSFLSNGESGTITICGSSSVAPLMEELAADYANYNPNAVIEIEISDSTEGLNKAMRGECDLAMSSRSLKSYEEELLEYKTIAADGIAVIVNEENPITELSLSQIQTIYDGGITKWSDLN